MKNLLIIVITCFVSTALISDAYARSINSKARGGVTTIVGGNFIYDKEKCTALRPGKGKVIREGKHGKVSFGPYTFKPTKGKCAGRSFPGTAVYYRGNGKKDTVKVLFRGAHYVDGTGNGVFYQTIKINH